MRKLLLYADNEPLSAITHFLGMLLSIAGLVLLVVYAAKFATPWHVVGFSIFGAALILLYLTSTWYHLVPRSFPRYKKVMQRIDHAMIYVLIAGTYTPICLTTIRGPLGWTLFGIVWALAAGGIVWKSIGGMPEILSLIVYIAMGWLAVVAFYPLMHSLSWSGLAWLFGGGIAYTLGAVIYALEDILEKRKNNNINSNKKLPKRKWFTLHDLWHIFVIAGSFCHFAFFFWHIL